MPSLRIKKNHARILVFLLLIVLCALVLLQTGEDDEGSGLGARAASSECSRCHGGVKTFSIQEDAPAEVTSGSTIVYSVTILNPDGNDGNPHELRDNELELEIGGTGFRLAEGEERNRTLPDFGEDQRKMTLEWQLVAEGSGEASLKVFVNSTAYYDHKSSSNPDSHRYHKRGDKRLVTVKELPVVLSQFSFALDKGAREIIPLELRATENLTDLIIETPAELKGIISFNSSHRNWSGSSFSALGYGESTQLNVTLSGDWVVDSAVVLRWVNESQVVQDLELRVEVFADDGDDGGRGNLRIFMKYLGWFSFILLFGVSVIGSRHKKVQKLVMRLFEKQSQRVWIHCLLSFTLLASALIHGVYQFFRVGDLMLDINGVFPGDLSAIFMGIVSVNGIFQKRLVEKLGYRNWWYIHVIGTVLALLTAILHIHHLRTLI